MIEIQIGWPGALMIVGVAFAIAWAIRRIF